MSDIVQQLRSYAQCADAFGFPDDAHISVRAADEIARLRGLLRRVVPYLDRGLESLHAEIAAAVGAPEATP